MSQLLPLLLLLSCGTTTPGEDSARRDDGAAEDGGSLADGGQDCVSSEEVCDGSDNDCDGAIDEGVTSTQYSDVDGDGFGDPLTATETCEGHGVDNGEDCDDTNPASHPDATEICDEQDNNCNGDIDEGLDRPYWADADADGYGDPDSRTWACALPDGYADNNTDCDDTDPAVNPDGTEVGNGKDDDCDGETDEGFIHSSCREILDAGESIGSGTYEIDPDPSDAEPPFDVLCDMEIDGGGWTQLLPDYLAHLSASDTRQYLYSHGSAWYASPETAAVWDWDAFQPVEGPYSYAASGADADGTFDCTAKESGSWGVGCSNGGGSTYKVLPLYNKDADNALSMICQDQPDVFGTGACQDDVTIWERTP